MNGSTKKFSEYSVKRYYEGNSSMYLQFCNILHAYTALWVNFPSLVGRCFLSGMCCFRQPRLPPKCVPGRQSPWPSCCIPASSAHSICQRTSLLWTAHTRMALSSLLHSSFGQELQNTVPIGCLTRFRYTLSWLSQTSVLPLEHFGAFLATWDCAGNYFSLITVLLKNIPIIIDTLYT